MTRSARSPPLRGSVPRTRARLRYDKYPWFVGIRSSTPVSNNFLRSAGNMLRKEQFNLMSMLYRNQCWRSVTFRYGSECGSGCGSKRPKNIRILRIRIPNTDTNRNFLPHVLFQWNDPVCWINSSPLWRSWRTWWNTKRGGTSLMRGTSPSWARTSWTTRWVKCELFFAIVVDP